MDGMTTERQEWMAGDGRRGTSVAEGVSRRKDRGTHTWVRRIADAWWRGWVAFIRAVGEPYLPLGGRAASGSVTRDSRGTRVQESEGERCA